MATKHTDEKETDDGIKPASALAPQGSVIEDNRLPNGKPNLAPTAGYDGHYPVQFSDESDQTYAERVAMFESSYASAVAIEKGGEDLASAKAALEARHNAELLALEKRFGGKTNTRVVKGKDGSTRGVDENYTLEKGEKFV